MYMRGAGMRGYGRRGLGRGRGLGQTPDVTSTITYLGVVPDQPVSDQTGQNQMIATPLSPAQLAAQSMANAAFFGTQQGLGPFGGGAGTASATFTQWLNKNAMTAVIGTVAFLVVWKAISK